MSTDNVRRRALSSASTRGIPPSHEFPEHNRLTPGGASACSHHGPSAPRDGPNGVAVDPTASRPDTGGTGHQSSTVWTETIVHAFIRACERRGCRPSTIKQYLWVLSHWPDRWPESASELQPALVRFRHLSPGTLSNYLTVWQMFGRFAAREYGLPNVPAQLDLAVVEAMVNGGLSRYVSAPTRPPQGGIA